jgi:riboflavin biosynthesis pyrimidine reductase
MQYFAAEQLQSEGSNQQLPGRLPVYDYGVMDEFQLLFDHGEPSESIDPALARYGKLGFPAPAASRPWIYANFVQTLDGIVSLLGDESGGADIGGLPEDRWLMDLLRAHADAVILGMGTLREEQRMGRPRSRGPVFRIMDAGLQQLRGRLHRGKERNVFVTAQADFKMEDYAVFDGELVDVTVVTTQAGAQRLEAQRRSHPWVDILVVDTLPTGEGVDLRRAVEALRDRYGMNYLLCEGGPTLYSGMLSAGLIDEKFVTVSPLEVGQLSAHGPRPTVLPGVGFSKKDAVRWSWLSCRKVADYQFHRFRRKLSGIC